MKGELIIPDESYKLDSPQQLTKLATVLKQAIVSENLYTNIKGKNYVNVEGWEFAGACTGIVPLVTMLVDLSTESEIKYRAEVELKNIHTNEVVGGGVAICSNKENTKKTFDEYAIASMAQTRAIGKAYRNIFAWLMKIAGYEPTPAEEISEEEIKQEKKVLDDNSPATDDQIGAVLAMARAKKVQVETKGMTSKQARNTVVNLSSLPVPKEEK